ncbi:MAG: glycosyltransferase [Asticcacaulis sp.]
MKLLHVIASVNPADGGPIEGLRKQHTVTAGEVEREIVSMDAPDAPYLAGFPMKVYAMGQRRPPYLPYSISPDMVPWLRANAGKYDAVIVHGLWNYAVRAAARVLPGSGVPYFVFTHGMMDPWFRKAYPLKHAAKQMFWLTSEGPLMAGARSVFFTSEEEKLLARGVFFGHPYKETVVKYGTAAPPEHTQAQAEAFAACVPALGDRPYLLFLSRIHPKKGCDLLIEAFAAIADKRPELDVVIAGTDQVGWQAELQAQAARLGLSQRVHFSGPLFGDAKWGAMHGAEAFVLPSHQENFGIAVAEALACARPVLISNQVNIWREIEADGAGLVAPDTVEGVSSLLERWGTADAATRQAMSVAALNCFRGRFDINITARHVRDTVSSFLRARA